MVALIVLLMVYACGGSNGTASSDAKRVENAEYRFSVAFPREVHVCDSMSGEHPHGFFVLLGQANRDCEPSGSTAETRAISVDAYGNTTFERTPEDWVPGLCSDGAQNIDVDIATLGFPGRHSARCHVRRRDGSIDIFVVAQAGQWPDKGQSAELDAPYVNYTAALHTTQNHVDADLKTFGVVLATVEIGYALSKRDDRDEAAKSDGGASEGTWQSHGTAARMPVNRPHAAAAESMTAYAESTPEGVAEGRTFSASKSVKDACGSAEPGAFRWAACDRVNELLTDMTKEPRDEAWAAATERQLRAYAEAEPGKFVIRGLECRQTICFIETASPSGGLPMPDYYFRKKFGLGKEYPVDAFETDENGVRLTITLFAFTRQ
jgi:hypothetical protein